jgi:hypothetical protein
MTLTDATKDRVVLKWLLNVPHAQITREEDISHGSVDNIVNEFFDDFGSAKNKAKLFFTAMRKSSLTFKHQAVSIKLLQILIRYVGTLRADGSAPSIAQLEKAVDLFEEWCLACDSILTDPARVIQLAKDIEASCAKI